MRRLLTVMAFTGALGCGGKARYFTPAPEAGPGEDAAAPVDAGLDAAPRDAGPDSGCHDDLDQDGVDSPACGGRDCNDADPTIKPRAEDPGEWLFERADELGWAVAPSVAVTADGVPHLLFEDRTVHAVVEAVRSGEGQWTRQVVEAGAAGPGAAVGGDGLVHVVFVAAAADPPALRHAVLEAGAWVAETAAAGVARHTPVRPVLAAGPGERLVAAFADEGPDGAVVRLATAEAGAWRDEDVAADGGAEQTDGRVALALDADGVPWLAWEHGGAIRVATREAGAWAVQALPLPGPATAPAIGRSAAGALAVSYRDQATRALGLARGAEGGWTTEVVDDRHGAGLVSALVFDPAGAVHLLYSAPDRFDTRWATDAYGEWLVVTIDRSAEPDVALAIDAAGADHLAYPTSDSDLHWSRHVGGDGIDQDCDGMPDSG